MFLELFSVSLFIPLVSLVLDSNIENNIFYLFFKNNLNFDLSFILSDLKNFLIFFIIVFLLKSLLTIYCNAQKIGFTYKIRKYLTSRIYQKYLDSSYEDFINENSSKYLKNINYEISLVSEGLLQLLEFFSEVIVITGIGIFLLYYDLEVSIIVLLISVSFLFLINFLTKKKIFQLGEKTRNFEQLRIKNYIESFNLIKEIKIYGKENFFKNRDSKLTSDFLQSDFIFRFFKSLPRVLVELLLIIILITLIFINIEQHDNYHVLEILGVFAAAAYRLMPSSNRIISSLQTIRYSLSSATNIVNELPKQSDTNSSNQNKKDISEFKKNIIFSNVSFKYKKSNKYIFENLDLTISKNKITGIKGKTGTGKTTIINLISGLVDPTKGQVSIDDLNYSDMNIKSLQKLIAYVPQSIYLMDTSIKENISFGAEKYTIKDIEEAILKSNLEKFVKEQPQGIESSIGEKSTKISGGQAQRVGIARALIKKPSILILDEATNSLDSETENQIMNSIKKLKNELSIIVISHDQKCLEICDEIIDLDKSLFNKK